MRLALALCLCLACGLPALAAGSAFGSQEGHIAVRLKDAASETIRQLQQQIAQLKQQQGKAGSPFQRGPNTLQCQPAKPIKRLTYRKHVRTGKNCPKGKPPHVCKEYAEPIPYPANKAKMAYKLCMGSKCVKKNGKVGRLRISTEQMLTI